MFIKIAYRLHISTKVAYQLPRLPESALKVPGGGWVAGWGKVKIKLT